MARKQKPEPEHSPAWRLLAHVWKHCPYHGRSWTRLNNCMAAALRLAVRAGMDFAVGDFAGFDDAFRWYRWRCEGGEHFYAMAIEEYNASAIKSFEAWKDRGPFIADDVCRDGHTFTRSRLAVGFSFAWKGKEVTVTSFAADGSHLRACNYEPRIEADPYSKRVLRIFRITAAGIQADRKDRKRRNDLKELVVEWPWPKRRRLLKALGISLMGKHREADAAAAWGKLDVARIEKAIEEAT